MTSTIAPPVRLLRKALRANAVFSGISALVFLLVAPTLATMVGIGASGFVSLGINLAVFAGLLTLVSTHWALRRVWMLAVVLVFIVMDVVWVVGSLVLGFAPSFVTSGGQVLIFSTAAIVGFFALLQGYAWVKTVALRWKHRGAPAVEVPAVQETV